MPNNQTFSHSGIKGGDLITLTQMLCVTYPPDIISGLIKIIDKKEDENVDFEEFLTAIKTIMLYDCYFEEMQPLFGYLDVKNQGTIKKDHLFEGLKKLRIAQEKAANENGDSGALA